MVLFHRAAVGGVLALLIRAELFQPGLQLVKPEFFGHPEVYIIMILPAFGIISQIVPAFARKQLFGDASIVYATASIATSKRLLS